MNKIYAVISILGLVALDQWSKYLTILNLKNKPDISLINSVLELTYVENRGAAFGLLENKVWLFIILTIIVLLSMIIMYLKLPKTNRFTPLRISLTILFAGAVGNFIDRVKTGFVVDMFHFYWFEFPVFNVADICVVISCILLIFLMLFYYKEEELDFMKMIGGKNNE